MHDNEVMRLLTEIYRRWMFGMSVYVKGLAFGFLYGVYVPFDKSKVISRKLVLSWLA